jgi:hypothetical protein
MGYQRKVYRLVFDDPEMDGLEVRAKSVSLGAMRKAADSDDEFLMMELFAKALVSWNLEDDGEPVPATLEGLEDQDPEFVTAIITAWTGTISGVPDASPLGGGSDSGRRSLEASIPMETLSPSRAS